MAHRATWQRTMYPVICEVIEWGYEGHNSCIPALFVFDALVWVRRVVLHVAKVEPWLVPPGLFTCTDSLSYVCSEDEDAAPLLICSLCSGMKQHY